MGSDSILYVHVTRQSEFRPFDVDAGDSFAT